MPAMKITSGKTQLCLALLSVLFLSGLCFAQPAVTLSVKSGPPTTNLQVSGTGFPAYTEVEIYFDTTYLALAVTNSAGSFSQIKIQVPASALPGINWVTAGVSGVTGDAAQASFTVNTNWAEFHFANSRSGFNLYENVLSPSTVGSLGLRWSLPTGNKVESSPAVANEVVYVGSDDNYLYALTSSGGKELWFVIAGGAVTSSPAVANGVVYVGSDDGNLYALTRELAQTPACIAGGFLAEECDLWQYTTPYPVYSSPAVANGVVYVGTGLPYCFLDQCDGVLDALDASTGVELWQFFAGPSYLPITVNTPAVANGVVYMGWGIEGCPPSQCAGFLDALDASTGVELWQFDAGPSLLPISTNTPVVADGVVYVGTSGELGLYALNASTGAQLWNFLPSFRGSSAPAVANGVVYVGSGDNNVYALDASTGTELWQYTTGGAVSSSPAVANGVVYVGSNDNNVYALNASTGALLWQYTTGGPVTSSPAIVNGVVYVGSTDGSVYAFSLPNAPAAAPERPDPATLRPNPSLRE
jgi:outer membrane protein assembly factor BamB